MEILIFIGLLLAIGWFWMDSLRTREIATGICAAVCRSHGWQLLDQTVAISRMRLRLTANGLRLNRIYRFDYSDEGVSRHTGWIMMLGMEMEALSLPEDTLAG